ncbi:hypothetical protein H4R18_004406, partial [Coemansia javaensis]
MFTYAELAGLLALNSASILCSLFVAAFIHMYRSDITALAAARRQHNWGHKGRPPGRQRSLLRPIGTQARMYLSLPASLRLLFVASVVDVLYSVFRIYYLGVNSPGFGGDRRANCKAVMAGVTFFNLLSVFVRALVCVHLQLVIFTSASRALHYERHFLAVALAVSLALSVVPLCTRNYMWLDHDPLMGTARCGYFELPPPGADARPDAAMRASVRKGLAIMWVTNSACLTLTVAYCAVVIVSVAIRLVQRRNAVMRLSKNQDLLVESAQQRRELLRMTTRVVRRVLQFPLMIFACHALEVVYGMVTLSRALQMLRPDGRDQAASQSLARLYLAAHVMLGLEGIATLLLLPLEPPIRLMLRRMYLRRRVALHRLGTVSRAGPRRKPSELWPSAREPRASSADALTLSSHVLPPADPSEAPVQRSLTWRIPDAEANGAAAEASAIVDHVVMQVRRVEGAKSGSPPPTPTPTRWAT